MPKPTSDDLVQRHKQLRSTLIAKHSKPAAEKVHALKNPTADKIAAIIEQEFNASPI